MLMLRRMHRRVLHRIHGCDGVCFVACLFFFPLASSSSYFSTGLLQDVRLVQESLISPVKELCRGARVLVIGRSSEAKGRL